MPDDPSATSSAAAAFEERTRFGSFEILRSDDGKPHLLGKGAFGRTYKARHVFLERTVALKIINDRFMADAKARERFLGEARAAAKLQHPHIAQILDFGETDGLLFYAMEYCSGGDLSDYVKRNGPLSVVQTVQIGLQVAAALQCAHAAGFIHRDLKPSNLMLATPDGPIVTKLIDFGLVIAAADESAAPIDPDDMPTIEQRFVGTPLFASPEQLLVQPLDARSDFFALGMTLWFLVLGSAPDPGNAAAVVSARLKSDSYAPRLPGKLPQAFQAVLARLLEKQPENRFANAAQLVTALGKCAAGLGLPTAPASAYKPGSGEALQAEETGPPQPAEIERIEVPVEECYTLQGERGTRATGSDFEARALADQSTVWLHFLKPALLANPRALEILRKNFGHLQRRPATAVLGAKALRQHPDRTFAIFEAPVGEDLLSFSKARGPIRLAEARPLLQSIASATDTLIAAGLPAPELEAHRIFVQPAETITPGSAQLLPRLLANAEIGLIDAAPVKPEQPGRQFAGLVYRVLAARNPATTPGLEGAAIAGLSAEANRLLDHALTGQLVHGTCSELLADLLIAEGLMGASITRTQSSLSATASPSSTQSAATMLPGPPPLPTTDDAEKTAAPAPRPLPMRPASKPAVTRTAARSPSPWPLLIGAFVVIVALAMAGAWFVFKFRETPREGFIGKNAAVQLQGDLPPHATAHVGPQTATLEHEGDHWRASFDASDLHFPAQLNVEARGFQPLEIPLNSAADLARSYDASLRRAEGTIVFKQQHGSDYDRAVLRMTAQLPEEQSFVELERFNRGIPFSTEPEAKLVTGIYQLTLRGPDERVVRPRLFDRVVIRAGETTNFELPPSLAGRYAGSLVPQRDGAPASESVRVEIVIESSLATGTYTEPSRRVPRRLAIVDGRLDSEGTYTAQIQFSQAAEGDQSFDQILSLRRAEDGSLECETSESPEENTVLERRLNRQPLPKANYFARGTLRPDE